MSLNALKVLLGHKDIRMTLGYAAITQESVREEYFTALAKTQIKYEIPGYSIKVPDLREGMNQSFYDAQRYIKKHVAQNGNPDPDKIKRLFGRLMQLRQEFSDLLKPSQT